MSASPEASAATCLNPHLHGSMSVGQRCVCGFEAAPGMPHDFVALIVTGNGSGSKDTISQCARCNLVRHDYEYDGGKRSPNYPTHHLRGMGVVDRGCTRGDMAEDRAAMVAEAAEAAPSSGPASPYVVHPSHLVDCLGELEPLAARMAKGRAKYPTGCTLLSLLDEAGEVAHAVNKRESHERVRDELLDVAAVAMRLYHGEIDTEWQPSSPFTRDPQGGT